MCHTACTEPQCLYKGALYLYLTVELYLYSPYGQYGLYRASVPVQGWPLPFTLLHGCFLISLYSVAGLMSLCQARRNSRVCYLTNCVRPWSRVVLKSLLPHLVKKFTKLCGTQRFINVFRRAHYMFLSCNRSVQSTACWPVSSRSVLLLYSHLCLGLANGLGFPTKTLYEPLLSPMHGTCLTYLTLYDLITQILFGVGYTLWNSLLSSLFHFSIASSLLGQGVSFSTLFSYTCSLCSSFRVKDQVSHPYKWSSILT